MLAGSNKSFNLPPSIALSQAAASSVFAVTELKRLLFGLESIPHFDQPFQHLVHGPRHSKLLRLVDLAQLMKFVLLAAKSEEPVVASR